MPLCRINETTISAHQNTSHPRARPEDKPQEA